MSVPEDDIDGVDHGPTVLQEHTQLARTACKYIPLFLCVNVWFGVACRDEVCMHHLGSCWRAEYPPSTWYGLPFSLSTNTSRWSMRCIRNSYCRMPSIWGQNMGVQLSMLTVLCPEWPKQDRWNANWAHSCLSHVVEWGPLLWLCFCQYWVRRCVSYPIHSRFSSEVLDVRSNQIQSTDPYRIHHDKLLHSYPVHITLNTAYFLHLVYPPFWYIGYAYFRLCLLIHFPCD